MGRFVEPDRTRSEDQRRVYEQIAKDGVCPFCQEHFLKYHTRPILIDGTHWVFTESAWPYEGTREHFLVVLKRHETDITKLTPEEGAELITLSGKLINEHAVMGGAMAIRFGNHPMLKNSVAHLHAQIIEPDFEKPHPAGVKLPISKKVA